MIEVRELAPSDLPQLTALRALCWPEELNGQSSRAMDEDKDLAFWASWMQTAAEHNDVRLMLGIFDNGRLLGAAIGSLADVTDIPNNGMELNGLWVQPDQRGRGFSLLLMKTVLCFFQRLGMDEVVIYNFHLSPSNSFYRQLRCRVLRQDVQMEEKVPVDIFSAELSQLLYIIQGKLEKYPINFVQLPFLRADEHAGRFTGRLQP